MWARLALSFGQFFTASAAGDTLIIPGPIVIMLAGPMEPSGFTTLAMMG